MKERPILFSGPMVLAILEGRKTQTRRILKGIDPVTEAIADGFISPPQCPYGRPGDRLWVRETWGSNMVRGHEHEGLMFYRADYHPCIKTVPQTYGRPWRPSIHMPRALSRISLEITGVRAQRLKDISEADALAEGVIQEQITPTIKRTAYSEFMHLWESIHGWDSWESNPWVWVIEFKKLEPSNVSLHTK